MTKSKRPTDTSRQEPATHLAAAMVIGLDGYIEQQCEHGQTEVASGTSIPCKLNACTNNDLLKLGFELSPAPRHGDGQDRLFRGAVLPRGWEISPTDHAMWSHLLDENGLRRGELFYKAAFYDRDAFLRLCVRLHMREDHDAMERDGTVQTQVFATLPNGGEKIIHTAIHEKKLPGGWRTEDKSQKKAYFEASDRSKSDAAKWLQMNYPNFHSYFAYWDMVF